MSEYALVGTIAIVGSFGVLSMTYWSRRREARDHLWFSVTMIAYAVFSALRLVQLVGVWADRPWIPAAGTVCAALLSARATVAFTAAFTGQRLPLMVGAAATTLISLSVVLVIATDSVLTKNPITRHLWGNVSFVGVEVGPQYFVVPLSVLVLWAISLTWFIRRRAYSLDGGQYHAVAFGIGFVVVLVDAVAIAWDVSAPRLSDFALLPMAFAFALAQADRYAKLFDALEDKVRERTRDLAQANEELSSEHAQREAIQERLAESQRLEALGRLAGGIAHDFNNLLTVVVSSNDLIRVAIDDKAQIEAACANIQDAADRGEKLVSQLMTFARQQSVTPKQVDLAVQLRGLAPMMMPLAGSSVRLSIEASDPAYVLIDPTQFDQIIVNLVINALAAMPEGGQLSIRVRAAEGAASEHGGEGLAPSKDVVEVIVKDTGTGIAADVLPRIFEPFFTTNIESGTGLGLATVRSATEQAGGTLSVDSELGVGTTFRIRFPRILSPATS